MNEYLSNRLSTWSCDVLFFFFYSLLQNKNKQTKKHFLEKWVDIKLQILTFKVNDFQLSHADPGCWYPFFYLFTLAKQNKIIS